MDYKKIFTDFEKRYGVKCDNAFFVGKPLTFFSRCGITAGCALSIGGVIALSCRDDDRLIAEFSDNSDFLNCNKLDFPYNTDKTIIRILSDVEKYGVKIGGARLLIYYNTDLTHPLMPLLISSLCGFCENTPPASELIKHFSDYEKNMLCIASRADCMTVFDGQRCRHLPLPDSELKIVLCRITENISVKKYPQDGTAKGAIEALKRGDFEKLGKLLNKETDWILSHNKNRKTQQLFDTAVRLSDAYGSGILEDGGIFSLVKNNRVDTFMHNLGSEYEKHFGARPDFYVTKAVDSGIQIQVPDNN